MGATFQIVDSNTGFPGILAAFTIPFNMPYCNVRITVLLLLVIFVISYAFLT